MVLNYSYIKICSMFLAYFFWHFNFVNINSHIGYKTLVCEFVSFVPFPIGVGKFTTFSDKTGFYGKFVPDCDLGDFIEQGGVFLDFLIGKR